MFFHLLRSCKGAIINSQTVIHLYVLFTFTGVLPHAQNVGIGIPTPQNTLCVNGNLAVGPSFSSQTAPPSGGIIEGKAGVGIPPSLITHWLTIATSIDWNGLGVRNNSGGSVQMLVDTRSGNAPVRICFYHNTTRAVCMESLPSQFMITPDLGLPPSSTRNLIIRRDSGFVGLGVFPTHRLTLPNIAGTSGQAWAFQWLVYSDSTWKENIIPISPDSARKRIMLLTPVRYRYLGQDSSIPPQWKYGFLAQEILRVFPELGHWTEENIAVWNPAGLVPWLTAVVQGQVTHVESLYTRLRKLQAKTSPHAEIPTQQ